MGETYREPGGGAGAAAPVQTSSQPLGAARALRIVCVTERAHETSVLCAALSTLLPSADVQSAAPSLLRQSPSADVIVVESEGGGHAALDWLRQLRARGFAGSALLVADAPAAEVHAAARQLGAPAIALGALPTELAAALRTARAETAIDEPVVATAMAELRRTQQLIAAGQIALKLQHALNNPLTGLLAEAQLLEMEETLAPDHLDAVRRIVELCRRTVAVARTLDGVSARPLPDRAEG